MQVRQGALRRDLRTLRGGGLRDRCGADLRRLRARGREAIDLGLGGGPQDLDLRERLANAVARRLDPLNERVVGFVDLLQVGLAREQVAEAGRVEQHARDVGRAALVDRDEPVRERLLIAAEASLPLAQAGGRDRDAGLDPREARPAVRELGLDRGEALRGAGGVRRVRLELRVSKLHRPG